MNKGLLIGALLVLVVVIIGYLVLANRTAPLGTTTQEDQTSQEYAAPGASLEGDMLNQTPAVSPSPPQAQAPTPSAAAKTFALTATNFKFSLAEIHVKKGDTVRVTLTNNSTMPHDFRVDEFNAATKTIENGQQDTVEFVASKTGRFEYYCSVGNHRAMGMKGTLIVE